jgi:glyoxylase-like metal-dependent hydrolase (beta-lactamase superfamily II)
MKRLLVVLAILLLGATTFAADGKFVNERYELKQIDANTYIFWSPPNKSGVVQSNCLVAIGRDSVLVVDTGQFPSLAKKMVADIKRLTPKPVRYIVITHWHLDHSWGNQEFLAAWPDAKVIAQEETRKMITVGGAKYRADEEQLPRALRDFRKMVAEGKTPSGRVLSEEEKEYFEFNAQTAEAIIPDFLATINIPPTVGYQKEMTIDLGRREAKVMWLGKANTAGDSIIWLPGIKLLATGDTVVHPAPYPYGSYFSEWAATMQKMIDLHAATIMPGHGPIMHDNSYLELVRDLTAATYSRVKALADKGLSAEEVNKQINLDDFKAKVVTTNDPWVDRRWRSYLHGAVDRAYQEATGKMKPELEF